MRYMRHLRLFVTVASSLLIVLSLAPVGAASANISHSYQAAESIPNGSIVSLDSRRSGYVDLANTENDSRLLGVVLPSQDSLLAIDPTNSTVQVAITGTVNTLVTNVNGNIRVGDQVSASPFNGIGMEALPGVRIIGIAQTGFNGNSAQATPEQVKDKSGKTQEIKVGYIKLTIAIASGNTSASGSQANFLQKLIKSLTGRTIPTIRIILGILVAFLSLVSLVTLIYTSIYGSIISVGRNPLAKHAIFRTLLFVMIVACLTIAIASVTIYYLLQ